MPSKTDINPATGKAYAINPSSGVWDDNYWANVVEPQFRSANPSPSVSSGGTTGSSADLLAKQKATEEDFLTRFRTAIGGQESTQAMADRLSTELGLPGLRKNAFNVNQQLEAVPDVQNAATRGYDVNENQRQRIIASKQAEMAPSAIKLNAQQQFAEGQLGERLGYGVQDQNKALLPFATEASMISDRAARELTGYTNDKQNELTIYLNKLASQQALTAQETARAQQLADDEANFERQKKLISFQTDEAVRQSKALKTGTGTGTNLAPYLPTRSPAPSYFKAFA